MALHWPTFFTRLGSAIVFSIVMMVGLLWNEWAFVALAGLIQFLCLREYFKLLKLINSEVHWPEWLQWAIQAFAAGLLLLQMPVWNGVGYPVLLFLPVLIMLGAVLREQTALMAVLLGLAGIFYISLPMILFLHLRLVHLSIPLALVLMIWMNDTMAYLVGSFIGKTPFSEISPKKTWEGTAGGAILTVVGAGIWGYYSAYYNITDWIVLALCAAIAGTAGDLLESKLKRMAGVKDSGAMMPGHGGALDRFDSLLVAIPFAFAYAYLFMF